MTSLTEKAIKESLLGLLEEKGLSEITVKDIVSSCGVNRNTFYYHFRDIPSLLEKIIEDDAEKIIEEGILNKAKDGAGNGDEQDCEGIDARPIPSILKERNKEDQ